MIARLAQASTTALIAAFGLWSAPLFAQPLFAHATSTVDTQTVPMLIRESPLQPTRYRVFVIPGSGCAGMAPIADRYFAGLQHAEVIVLHKPWVDPDQWPAPHNCPASFVQQDDLASWLRVARAAIRQYSDERPSTLPVVLVGISEGAELLPALAADQPDVKAVVMISNAGLDPAEVGAMQAERLGQKSAWDALLATAASDRPDSAVVEGRTLRYWRSLLHWRVLQPLLDLKVPILQAWGGQDALIPASAYARFQALAAQREAGDCAMTFADADHGLQAGDKDEVQVVWGRVEASVRNKIYFTDPHDESMIKGICDSM
ncbi:MAG: alpha/beta hydrolase [Burkholderiales bacterium]|nr:alpha/beta hydrolase [Burkholderiales bacterium]